MNDLFWENGFTDWVTTKRGTPLFNDHEQPFLPLHLNFYDLTEIETLNKQATLAKAHGIDGFGFYHYFFDQKTRALNLPIENLRRNTSIDIEYFICWVNADWTRAWIGDYQSVLYKQKYSPQVFNKLAENACWYFQDSRYARFDGKPLIYIHNPRFLNFVKFKEQFLKVTSKFGFNEVLFAAPLIHLTSKQECEVDFALGYPPGDYPIQNIKLESQEFDLLTEGVFSYPEYANKYPSFISKIMERPNYVPTIMSGWDNTPRYGKAGFVFLDFSAEEFSKLSQEILQRSVKQNKQFAMIKAWNEWAEGNVLEPSVKFGHKILQSVKETRNKLGF